MLFDMTFGLVVTTLAIAAAYYTIPNDVRFVRRRYEFPGPVSHALIGAERFVRACANSHVAMALMIIFPSTVTRALAVVIMAHTAIVSWAFRRGFKHHVTDRLARGRWVAFRDDVVAAVREIHEVQS